MIVRMRLPRRLLLAGLPALAAGRVWAQADGRAALIEAAKREGTVTWYSSLLPQVTEPIAAAMRARFGLDVKVLRLASAALTQRYASEAEAGNVAADVIMPTSSGPFLATAHGKGWTIAPQEAGVPAITSGEFPARWRRDASAAVILQVLPWIFGYNTEKFAALKLEPPTDWPGLLEPKLAGQILISDPEATDSYIQLWDFVLSHYGEDYLKKLRAQKFRLTASGAPNIQAVAAGEGAIGLPTIGSLIEGVAKVGAPVKPSVPVATTGNEIAITISRQAPHPNAARLLVDFLLTREGNMILGSVPNEFSVYRSDLPSGYESPKEDAVARSKARIVQLMKGA